MADNLKPLYQVVDLKEGHLIPPILENGKEYRAPYISAETGLEFGSLMATMAKIQAAVDAGQEPDPSILEREALSDREERELYRDALSPEVFEEMMADGVPFFGIRMAAMYVLLKETRNDGGAAAREFWNSGGKAPAPNRATRRTATRTRTGGASTTRKRA